MSEIDEHGAVFTEHLGVDGVRMKEPPRVDELDLGEVPQLFTGAKAELDPAGIITPGVLLQPTGAATYSGEGDR